MSKIFIAGHKGMVGSALLRYLSKIDAKVVYKSREELDLLDQKSVLNFFMKNRFDQVYLAAAKVGGIHANSTFPAEFIYENLCMQTNIIDSAHKSDVNKLLFLGSSCIYPKNASQPINESELLNGYLEPTNEPYAIAKIAGIKMCNSYNKQYKRDYRCVMPTNLYGPNDNFHKENSHVIPGLIRRFYEAKEQNSPEVELWGTGTPLREFLHVDDLASACYFIMNLKKSQYDEFVKEEISHVNIGFGTDISIKDVSLLISKIIGYSGKIKWDTNRPDGTMKKLMDSSILNSLGWAPSYELEDGLKQTIAWFINNNKSIRET